MMKLLFGLILVTNIYANYWQCYAKNNYGKEFYGIGYTKYEAEFYALETCRLETDIGRCKVTNYCEWVQ